MIKFYRHRTMWPDCYVVVRTADHSRWLVPAHKNGWAAKAQFLGLLTNCVAVGVDGPSTVALLGMPDDPTPDPGLSATAAAIFQPQKEEPNG